MGKGRVSQRPYTNTPQVIEEMKKRELTMQDIQKILMPEVITINEIIQCYLVYLENQYPIYECEDGKVGLLTSKRMDEWDYLDHEHIKKTGHRFTDEEMIQRVKDEKKRQKQNYKLSKYMEQKTNGTLGKKLVKKYVISGKEIIANVECKTLREVAQTIHIYQDALRSRLNEVGTYEINGYTIQRIVEYV